MYITCSWTTGFLLDLNGSSHLERDCPGQATTVMYTPVLWPQDRTKFFFTMARFSQFCSRIFKIDLTGSQMTKLSPEAGL